MGPADLLRVYEQIGLLRKKRGGRYRIRTRVLGLEIQGDIQATLIARDHAWSPTLHEVHLKGRAHFGHREGALTVSRSQVNPQ